jgi:hypothetical protein
LEIQSTNQPTNQPNGRNDDQPDQSNNTTNTRKKYNGSQPTNQLRGGNLEPEAAQAREQNHNHSASNHDQAQEQTQRANNKAQRLTLLLAKRDSLTLHPSLVVGEQRH